jgi:hypothetical protein
MHHKELPPGGAEQDVRAVWRPVSEILAREREAVGRDLARVRAVGVGHEQGTLLVAARLGTHEYDPCAVG